MGIALRIHELEKVGFTFSILPTGKLKVIPSSKFSKDEHLLVKQYITYRKKEIISYIQQRHEDESTLLDLDDYVDFYEERAAILEFEAGLSREDAQWNAMNETMLKFMEDQKIASFKDQEEYQNSIVYKFMGEMYQLTNFNF